MTRLLSICFFGVIYMDLLALFVLSWSASWPGYSFLGFEVICTHVRISPCCFEVISILIISSLCVDVIYTSISP